MTAKRNPAANCGKGKEKTMTSFFQKHTEPDPVFIERASFIDYINDKLSGTGREVKTINDCKDIIGGLFDEMYRLSEENKKLWVILKTCTGCIKFDPSAINMCPFQEYIDLSGITNTCPSCWPAHDNERHDNDARE